MKFTPKNPAIIIEASQFHGPMDALNKAQAGEIPVPCYLKIGHSTFGITRENLRAFSLGVLFAVDEAWEQTRPAINQLLAEPEEEAPIHDEVKCCPDCERPNQFGELCPECQRERQNVARGDDIPESMP